MMKFHAYRYKIDSGRLLLSLIAVLLVLPLFSDNAAAENRLWAPFVTIWDAPESINEQWAVDFSNAPTTVQNQRKGFEKGLTTCSSDLNLLEYQLSEQLEIAELAAKMANLYNNNNGNYDDEVLMGVGASTDLMTMYTAMETEFFSIPFLIPFADGIVQTGKYSGYALRMTPSTTDYANYFKNSLVPADTLETINTVLFMNSAMPSYTIDTAVFYENNYNGNSVAVAVTQNLMDSGINIELYKPFSNGRISEAMTDSMRLEPETLDNIDLVVVIGEDNKGLLDEDEFLNYWENRQTQPIVIMLGFRPGKADSAMINAENVFAIRQKIDMSSCPAEIVNQDEAMGYAAGYLTCRVMNNAASLQPPRPNSFFMRFNPENYRQRRFQEYLESFRNNIRNAFSDLDEIIPCYGRLNFASGTSNRISLELVRYTGTDTTVSLSEYDIFTQLMHRVAEKTGTPYQ